MIRATGYPCSTRTKARILIVEDTITNQQVGLAMLKNMGLSADAVANGQEAIEALECIPYDLVFMDCQMPVMDGYDATRVIRNPASRVRNHRIPVIAMTAHGMDNERDKCLQAGMDDFIAKPVLPHVLAEKLEKWLPTDKECHETTSPADSSGRVHAHHQADPLPVWDRAGMLARLMGDEQVASVVCQGFLADMPVQLAALESSFVAGDATSVARQAHTIKGAAANIGGERLKTVAMAIEQSAGKGNLDAAHWQLDEIRREFDALQQEMTALSIERLCSGAYDEDTDR